MLKLFIYELMPILFPLDDDRRPRSRSRPPLVTEEKYYTSIGEKDSSGETEWKSEFNQSNVEVPAWREKVCTSLYVIEGTENLNSEFFLKRHQKPETDERRRKRYYTYLYYRAIASKKYPIFCDNCVLKT